MLSFSGTRASTMHHRSIFLGSKARYDRITILLHWVIGVALLAQIAFGFMLDDIAPRGTPTRAGVINLHKSLGIVLRITILVRVGWRLAHRPPPWSDAMPRWQQRAALWTRPVCVRDHDAGIRLRCVQLQQARDTESPEGVGISPDGRWVTAAVEESNDVAFVDTTVGKVAFGRWRAKPSHRSVSGPAPPSILRTDPLG